MDYEKWYAEAINQIKTTISVGQTFELKGLFTGAQWDTLSPGDRKSFGRYFSGKVKSGLVSDVKKQGESKSHHSKYIKTE